MNNPTVSVVVPVYNTEKVLGRSIDSILRQDYADYELILVDDGSKDSSGRICDEYKEKDTRVVVIHKENGGVSSARNAGIDSARGKYIAFIDSDDWVADDYLSVLCGIFTNDVDLVVAREQQCTDDETAIYQKGAETDVLSFSVENVSKFSNLLKDNWLDHIHAKCFRADVIKEHELRFLTLNTLDGDVFFMEDTYFVMEYLARCTGKVALCDRRVYAYVRFLENSLTGIKRGYFYDRMLLYWRMACTFESMGMLNEDAQRVICKRVLLAAIRELRRSGNGLSIPLAKKRKMVSTVLSFPLVAKALQTLHSFDSKEDLKRFKLLENKSVNYVLFKCVVSGLINAALGRMGLISIKKRIG